MAGFLSTLFGGGAETEAADANRRAIAAYAPQAQGYLQQGYDTGVGNLNSAIGAYTPLSTLANKYGGASDMYLNALGLNGPQGSTAAQSAFQSAPGTQAAIDYAMQQLNRQRAGTGMLNSGNTDIDALNLAQNNQNQQWNSWLQNLSGAGQTGLQAAGAAASGQGAGYTGLASLAQTMAGNQAGVAGNVLSGNMDANKLQAAGEAAGAKNLLGLGTSLLSLGSGSLGGGLFKGLGTTLGNSMMGGGSPSGY